jgi:Cu-Zn family superoxide dismutase
LAAPESRAIAELKNKDGKIIGQAFFRERSDGVLVRMDVKGLTPGLHGVHIHSVGKCEEPSFTTAGEHFNPAGKKHGLNSPAGPHAGDLPNMLVAKDGSRRLEVRTDAITFKVGAASVFDSAGAAP